MFHHTRLLLALALVVVFSLSTLSQPFEDLSASPHYTTGCKKQDNRILIGGFSSKKWVSNRKGQRTGRYTLTHILKRALFSRCETSPCVITGDAILKQVSFKGCGTVTCTDEADNLASILTKRTGKLATSSRGGQGTCALTYGTESIFYCSKENLVNVTVDSLGVPSFQSDSKGVYIPTAYFASQADSHGVSTQRKNSLISLLYN